MIIIEHNIPIPEPVFNTYPGAYTTALRTMGIGDSFVIPKSKRQGICMSARLADVRVATRTISATEVRVWKIKATR